MAADTAADTAANPPAFGAGAPHLYPWWLILIEGIAAVLLGVMFFITPGITAATVAFFVAIYWMVTGVITLASLFWDRSQWGWKLLWGSVSVVAGWYIIGNLVLGTVVLLWAWVFILGFQGLLIGVVEIVQGFQGAGWGRGTLGVFSALIGGWIIWLALQQPAEAVFLMAWVFGALAIVGGLAAIFFSFKVKGMETTAGSGSIGVPA